jgi:hypothetical protein
MPSLLLHAADPLWWPADPDSLTGTLLGAGLIRSPALEDRCAAFPVGAQFLKLVMFLGCSPQVTVDPETAEPGQTACHVRLLSHQRVTFVCAKIPPAPRCPNCRAAAELVSADAFDSHYHCRNCGEEHRLTDLDWRQGAGYGRFFIEINGIYPQEAVPSDKLLTALRDYSGCNWKYFYI